MDFEKKHGNINNTEAERKKIEVELGSFGIPQVPEIIERFVILEKNSHFNDDSRMILEGVKNVLELIDSFQLTPIQKMRLYLAVDIGDIGKTSSSEDVKCQLAVARLFSKENLDPNQRVTKVLQLYFPAEEVDDMILSLLEVEVSPEMEMRKFWDKHAFWTQEILDRHQDVFDKPTRVIAASHHLNSGIDPYKIKVDNVWQVSNEVKFSIFLLMAMDKYQALTVRSKKSHKEAIELLKIELTPFDGDDLKDIIVRAIEQLGAISSLFPESVKALKAKRSAIIK